LREQEFSDKKDKENIIKKAIATLRILMASL
jgi:hypothetical protein